MILGCIADDFTGAGDLASILAGEGMSTSLIPSIAAIAGTDSDAAVVALKTRSVPVAEAIARSLEALEALRAAGCRQFFFKYCSTFDSTPAGNIGPVAEALADALGVRGVIACPAFPANKRTVYQGHLFVGDTLLSESGMRDHPLTPMTDSDIRRWLTRQSREAAGHVPHAIVREGAGSIAAALAADPAKLVVVDAICDADLRAIAIAARDAPLLTGGSALALGLPDNYRAAGAIGGAEVIDVRSDGPALVLAGSCSVATNAQVACYRADHPALAIDVARLVEGGPVLDEADAFARANADAAPLIYSTAQPAETMRHDAAHGPGVAAAAIERLIADLARRAAGRGVRRIVVAGGETSGAVIEALAPGPLRVGRSIAPGVPILSAGDMLFALKSGNFGGEDFFARAVAMLGGAA